MLCGGSNTCLTGFSSWVRACQSNSRCCVRLRGSVSAPGIFFFFLPFPTRACFCPPSPNNRLRGDSIAFGSAPQREADSQPISQLVRQAGSQTVSWASRQAGRQAETPFGVFQWQTRLQAAGRGPILVNLLWQLCHIMWVW